MQQHQEQHYSRTSARTAKHLPTSCSGFLIKLIIFYRALVEGGSREPL
jgi:hypothetical protein